jgi:hypothetical protein
MDNLNFKNIPTIFKFIVFNQGNTYNLPIRLKFKGTTLSSDNVKKVEFAFGKITKTYPKEVTFEEDAFIIPFTQEETFSFNKKEDLKYQARVMFLDNSVKSTPLYPISINESISKEVLR